MDVAALSIKIDTSDLAKASDALGKVSSASDRAAASVSSSAGKISSGLSRSGQSAVSAATFMDKYAGSGVSSFDKLTHAANNNTVAMRETLVVARELASGNLTRLPGSLSILATQFAISGKSATGFASQLLQAFGLIKQVGNAGLDGVAGQAAGVAGAIEGNLKNAQSAAVNAGAEIELAEAQARAATTANEQAAASERLALAQKAQIAAEAEAAIAADALASANEAVAETAAEAAAAEATALAPLAIAIGAIILVLAPFVAGLVALNKQANDDSGLKKYTTSMGYTKAEVKQLNDITVSFGDTFKAVFQVGFERVASAFGLTTGDIKKAWNSVLDFLITATRATVAGVYAAFTGMAYAVERAISNIKAGKAENPFTTLTEGYKTAYGDAQKFMEDVVKQARTNAQKRQADMAKDSYDKPKEKKNPLDGILQGAQDDINTENARAAAVGLSARAADELEQRTKLLNQIQKAGIPLTDALRGKVDALSKAYADAKVAADYATAVQASLDSLDKQNDAINDQTATIGLYGDALNKAKAELDALTAARNALPKGESLTGEDSARIISKVDKNAADLTVQNRLTDTEKIRKDAEDQMYALDLERKGLGLTGAAADAYAYSTERLNDAQKAGRPLNSDQVDQLNAAAAAYGKTRYAIDQQAQAISDARDIEKSFFTDWISDIEQGKSAFKAFADAVVNALNSIISKLLDKTLTNALGGGSGGGDFLSKLLDSAGGGGSWSASTAPLVGSATPFEVSAKGNMFGVAQRFANGGTFTNSIVTSPTLFRFANGAKMGEMGEAGPEAVVPLKRGANGSLGVQVHGGGKPTLPPIYIQNDYHLTGTVSQKDVQSMVQQGAEATTSTVKRSLNSWLQDWHQDGAVAT
jgi:hypothetical protein